MISSLNLGNKKAYTVSSRERDILVLLVLLSCLTRISMIPARYRPTVYPTQALLGPDEPRVYKCDLCDNSFEDEDELSKHIESKHVDN